MKWVEKTRGKRGKKSYLRPGRRHRVLLLGPDRTRRLLLLLRHHVFLRRRGRIGGTRGSDHGLVEEGVAIGMLPLPALGAKVAEALQVPAKVRSRGALAHAACTILQVGINLDLGGWTWRCECPRCRRGSLSCGSAGCWRWCGRIRSGTWTCLQKK